MSVQRNMIRSRGEQQGMTIFKNIRLGLLHVAVGVTFVVINGMLNRVMIHDLGILSTIVALLVVLPYFLSPLQVVVGQYSDNHPLWGYRRTPYIAAGLLLSVGGTALAPHAAKPAAASASRAASARRGTKSWAFSSEAATSVGPSGTISPSR